MLKLIHLKANFLNKLNLLKNNLYTMEFDALDYFEEPISTDKLYVLTEKPDDWGIIHDNEDPSVNGNQTPFRIVRAGRTTIVTTLRNGWHVALSENMQVVPIDRLEEYIMLTTGRPLLVEDPFKLGDLVVHKNKDSYKVLKIIEVMQPHNKQYRYRVVSLDGSEFNEFHRNLRYAHESAFNPKSYSLSCELLGMEKGAIFLENPEGRFTSEDGNVVVITPSPLTEFLKLK